jgi:hypothetical protein
VNIQQWYRADIQWAVMVAGKEGLREWEESVYLFPCEDRDAAVQKALEIGRRDRHLHCHEEGRRWVERRLARIAVLEELGVNPTEIEVYLGNPPGDGADALRTRIRSGGNGPNERLLTAGFL